MGDTQKRLIRERKKLGTIKDQIKEEKREIRKADSKERDLLEELNHIDDLLARRRKEVTRAEKDLLDVKKRIKSVNKRIEHLEEEKRLRKRGLKKRLIALYKLGNIGPVNLIFSSDSHLELEKKYIFMQSVIENDALAIENYLSSISTLDDNLSKLDAERAAAKALRLKLAEKRDAVSREMAKKKRLVASISRSKALHKRKLAELKVYSRKLERLLVKLEESLSASDYVPYGGGSFSALKGRLDMPFNGEVTAFFGKSKDVDFNTDIIRKGIDIAAPLGSDVKAIYDGKVIYADRFKGYGNIVIIDHGDGYYTLSANLSKILKKAGEEVTAGSLVALSGDTGSLAGPRLYFEIRHRGKPVDPLDWLKVPSKNRARKSLAGRKR